MIDGERDVCEQFDTLLREQGWTVAFVTVSAWIQEDKHRITRDDVQELAMKHCAAIAAYEAGRALRHLQGQARLQGPQAGVARGLQG